MKPKKDIGFKKDSLKRGGQPQEVAHHQGLTPIQTEIYRLIYEEGLSHRKAAQRRGCKKYAITKAIRLIKKKLGSCPPPGCPPLYKGKGCPPDEEIRLHGEQYVARILYRFPRYDKVRKNSPMITIKGFKLKLNKRTVEIYSLNSYMGKDASEATMKSLNHLSEIIKYIENDVGAVIIKDRYHNLRRVKAHYSEINNELAQDCEKKKEKIKIFAREDGKLWFQIDNSFNLHEAETQHPATAKEDIDKVKVFFDDLRELDGLVMSDILKVMRESVLINKETAAGLGAVVKMLAPREPAEPERLGEADYIG